MELDVHRRKLVRLVGELLQKADEIDRDSKEHKTKLDREWHRRLAEVCKDLAGLSQAATGIDDLIKANNANAAQDSLLRSVNIANHLSHTLNELKREAGQC
jgi:hypothetical protein